jgi:hypothetical protein
MTLLGGELDGKRLQLSRGGLSLTIPPSILARVDEVIE